MVEPRSAILQGTLDLMVLKTLEQMGPLHGYGIARRIEQVGQQAVIVNQGTIYLCLVRLGQKRWISSRWGTSENNRRARYYAITKAGRPQLQAETENWERISGVIGRVLRPPSQGSTGGDGEADLRALFHTARPGARVPSSSRRRDGFRRRARAHLAMAEEDKVRRGMSPEQARREARLELGGVAQLREAARAARGLPWLETFWLDAKLGLRRLRKPGG